jgi:hypothetical protein
LMSEHDQFGQTAVDAWDCFVVSYSHVLVLVIVLVLDSFP